MTVTPNEAAELDRLCEHAGWVRDLARHLVADAALADDLAQDAWVRAARGPLPARGSFRAWIATVLRNLVVSHHRTTARRELHERQAPRDSVVEEPADLAARFEAHESLIKTVRGLEEPYRTVVLLRYFDGLSPHAIAEQTGSPVRTVHTRLQRAMSMLRARLDTRHGDRRAWLTLLTPLVHVSRTATIPIIVAMNSTSKLATLGVLIATVVAVFAWYPTTPSIPAPTVTTADLAAIGVEIESAEGVAPERTELDHDSVPVAASEPFQLRGLVLDLESHLIADVQVVFTPFGNSTDRPQTTTNGMGVFDLVLPAVAGGTLDVEDPQWSTVYRPILWGEPNVGELTLIVAPNAPVSGRVIDRSGQPIENARVESTTASPNRAMFSRSLERDVVPERSTASDADGQFTLPSVPLLPDSWLHVTHPEFQVHRAILADRNHLVIELGSKLSQLLSGRVILPDGKPAAGAAVMCGNCAVNADNGGRFAIDLGRSGEDPVRHTDRWLIAAMAGRIPATLRCDDDDFNNPAKWPVPLILQLGEPPLEIRGRIVNASGRAIAVSQVTLLDQQPLGDRAQAGARVDQFRTVEFLSRVNMQATEHGAEFSELGEALPRGEFRMRGLQDRTYRLLFEDKNTLLRFTTEPIHAGTRDVEIVIPKNLVWDEIHGVVVDRRGNPVNNAVVCFERQIGSEAFESSNVETDTDGRFTKIGLVRTAATMLVQTPGIAHPTRYALDDFARLEDLRITAPVKTSVQVEQTATSRRADSIVFFDREDERIAATITQGNMAWGRQKVPVVDGRTEVFTVPDDAVVAVLFAGDREIGRMPVDLTPERLHALRF